MKISKISGTFLSVSLNQTEPCKRSKMRIKKQQIFNHFHQKNFDLEDFSGLIFLFLGLISIKIVAPIFLPKNPSQPYIKDVTVIIPNGGLQSAISSLRNSGFETVHAISYDRSPYANAEFATYRQVEGTFGSDIDGHINSSFVLYSGVDAFRVPPRLPKLPVKPMVIGYTFSECRDDGFALLAPTGLEYALLSAECVLRFTDFSARVLRHRLPPSSAFAAFAEFHSLRLLVLPCRGSASNLPKWESLEVVEHEGASARSPWGNIPKIPEVWLIHNLL